MWYYIIIVSFQSNYFTTLGNECLGKLFPSSVCFHINSASRGTAVSTYEYAHQTEKILNLRSIIIYPYCLEEEEKHQLESIGDGIIEGGLERFRRRFGDRVYSYNNNMKNSINCKDLIGGVELVKTALHLNCSILYMQKYGTKDSPPAYPNSFSNLMPTAVHAIFRYERHGTYYASLNENIPFFPPYICGTSNEDSCDETEFLSYVVTKPKTVVTYESQTVSLREELGIAPDTLVVCNHGGRGSFDVSIAAEGVNLLIAKYNSSRLQFLILGSLYASNGTSIRYLPQISSIDAKERFFNACSCMLHARFMGETFGLAVAEFSIRNKPVLTYTGPLEQHLADQEHIRILGRKGYYYSNAEDIVAIISDWVLNGIPSRDYNAYRSYSPNRIMDDFKRIFLRNIVA